MSSNQPSNTRAIIGLVLAILAIIFSFIPCIGSIAFIPGVIGLILGGISLMKAKDDGHPQGLSITVLVISILACAISAYQIYTFSKLTSGVKEEMKEYTNCKDIELDYRKVESDMAALTEEMEKDNASFASIGQMTKLGMKLGHIQKSSEELGCDINFDDFDPSPRNTNRLNEADSEGIEEDKAQEEEGSSTVEEGSDEAKSHSEEEGH